MILFNFFIPWLNFELFMNVFDLKCNNQCHCFHHIRVGYYEPSSNDNADIDRLDAIPSLNLRAHNCVWVSGGTCSFHHRSNKKLFIMNLLH